MADQVTVYGTDWCGDGRRARRHLDKRDVKYRYVNIDEDTDGESKVLEFNNGKRRVPLVEIASENGTKSPSVP